MMSKSKFVETVIIGGGASGLMAGAMLKSKEFLILEGLHDYRFSPAGNFGYTKAEVTRGGVSTHEIDSSTMMSKKIDNLYFLGEVLDVTGELGGYNFQWAFSSAMVCARGILKS
ncbi:MAG: NAD(P)/FAD-dependent oxidoreductase [Epsilonproteobacteria bacterium]|nr:NAD(P)/FAD-dependent oxidoreductase [Campylobacterota bacterium]